MGLWCSVETAQRADDNCINHPMVSPGVGFVVMCSSLGNPSCFRRIRVNVIAWRFLILQSQDRLLLTCEIKKNQNESETKHTQTATPKETPTDARFRCLHKCVEGYNPRKQPLFSPAKLKCATNPYLIVEMHRLSRNSKLYMHPD